MAEMEQKVRPNMSKAIIPKDLAYFISGPACHVLTEDDLRASIAAHMTSWFNDGTDGAVAEIHFDWNAVLEDLSALSALRMQILGEVPHPNPPMLEVSEIDGVMISTVGPDGRVKCAVATLEDIAKLPPGIYELDPETPYNQWLASQSHG